MKVIFVRHGEINSNINHVYSGRSQEPLNTNGLAQVERVAHFLKNEGITGLFCSPLLRAVETAKRIALETCVEPVVLESFNELAMGPWEGLSETEAADKFPKEWHIWNTTPAALHLQGRETLAQLQERALAGLAQIHKMSSRGQKTCVVSHVAVIRVILLYFKGIDLNQYKKVSVPNASPIVLNVNEHKLPKTN